jgi:hypothetical protein
MDLARVSPVGRVSLYVLGEKIGQEGLEVEKGKAGNYPDLPGVRLVILLLFSPARSTRTRSYRISWNGELASFEDAQSKTPIYNISFTDLECKK